MHHISVVFFPPLVRCLFVLESNKRIIRALDKEKRLSQTTYYCPSVVLILFAFVGGRLFLFFFSSQVGFSMPCEAPALSSDTRPLAAARPHHASPAHRPSGVPGDLRPWCPNRLKGPTAKLKRPGGVEWTRPGDGLLDPRNGKGMSLGTEGFLSRRFPPGDGVTCFGFPYCV